ncbi:MAG: hypothetical protein JSS34_05835 [Proteobacteria bacterium]|nr:hypothetical protein [Pseudomonadota bacterium]
MSIISSKKRSIFSSLLLSSLLIFPLESFSKDLQKIDFSSKEALDPRITQVFNSDWSIVKVRESSFVIRLKQSALERLIRQAAETKEQFKTSPGTIEAIITWANDSFKNIPDAEGTISISFLPPPDQNLTADILTELKEMFAASPFELKMEPRVWEIKAPFSSLPSPDIIKEVIESIETELKNRNIFPDISSKSTLEKAWSFAKASIVEVELIIHIKV